MRTILLTACFAFLMTFTFCRNSQGQGIRGKTDKRLQKKLSALTKDFKGEVGIYVYHLNNHKTANLRADSLFPTASLIKVPILVTLCEKISRDEIRFDTLMLFRDSLRYSGTDLLNGMQNNTPIPLSEVMMLMITTSDNTAALWCQTLAGTGTNINRWLETNGFAQTRINSRTPGREADRETYGWGQTTPREMAQLLLQIRQGKVVNPAVSEQIARHLSRIFWDGEALSEIPPQVLCLSKQGAVNASRSEVVLVHAPHGDYVFCVMTNHQQDQSWDRQNEGFQLIRAVSRTLWRHFEPKSRWQPPGEGFMKQWRK
jgi:beta-lactamase class A